MNYSLIFKPSVVKDLKRLSKTTILRVFKQILRMQKNPISPQDVKLSGMEHLYRTRVGDYRIIYEVDHSQSLIVIHYITLDIVVKYIDNCDNDVFHNRARRYNEFANVKQS